MRLLSASPAGGSSTELTQQDPNVIARSTDCAIDGHTQSAIGAGSVRATMR